MFVVFPWMLAECKYKYHLILLYAYIWNFCQGFQGYELVDGWENDIQNFCGIPSNSAKSCIDELVEFGALKKDSSGNIYYPTIDCGGK